MYIMTKNGWQPIYIPQPTYVIVGGAHHDDSKVKTIKFYFEYFRGSEEKAKERAREISRTRNLVCTAHLA